MSLATGTAPGKSYRKGICCPYCGSLNMQLGAKHKTMPFRCREKGCGRK